MDLHGTHGIFLDLSPLLQVWIIRAVCTRVAGHAWSEIARQISTTVSTCTEAAPVGPLPQCSTTPICLPLPPPSICTGPQAIARRSLNVTSGGSTPTSTKLETSITPREEMCTRCNNISSKHVASSCPLLTFNFLWLFSSFKLVQWPITINNVLENVLFASSIGVFYFDKEAKNCLIVTITK